jgi:flavorubredoxin
MENPIQAMPDIFVLPAFFQIPGMGFLPVNAFVIKAKEPILIDTGMGIESEDFMKSLSSVIDPKDLRWIWLTHDDADHTGSVQKVVDAAPKARLAANSLAVLRSMTAWSVPMERVYWLNSGDSIQVGDRQLTAVRPPLFDNPTTIGVYDSKSKSLFSADFFGGIIPTPAQNADEIEEEGLNLGMITWACADSPWVHLIEPRKFTQALNNIRQIDPEMIFSAHLPIAKGKTAQFLKLLEKLPSATPFVTPDQKALEKLMSQMKSGN